MELRENAGLFCPNNPPPVFVLWLLLLFPNENPFPIVGLPSVLLLLLLLILFPKLNPEFGFNPLPLLLVLLLPKSDVPVDGLLPKSIVPPVAGLFVLVVLFDPNEKPEFPVPMVLLFEFPPKLKPPEPVLDPVFGEFFAPKLNPPPLELPPSLNPDPIVLLLLLFVPLELLVPNEKPPLALLFVLLLLEPPKLKDDPLFAEPNPLFAPNIVL